MANQSDTSSEITVKSLSLQIAEPAALGLFGLAVQPTFVFKASSI